MIQFDHRHKPRRKTTDEIDSELIADDVRVGTLTTGYAICAKADDVVVDVVGGVVRLKVDWISPGVNQIPRAIQ